MWLSKTSIHYVGYRKFNRTPPHISLETMHFRRSSPSILWIIGPSPAGEVCWKSRSPKFSRRFRPLSGPAETSNTVVLPFYHVFFYEHCDLKSGVYKFFGQLGPGDWQNPPSGCRRCWLRMDLSLPTCSQHSHTVYCPSPVGRKRTSLFLLVIFPLRSHTFFLFKPCFKWVDPLLLA